MNTKLHFSSATDDWATPQYYFDLLHREFCFTLDVCASDQNAKCPAYFTKETNGLAQDWKGTCFMNPPYGRGMDAWIRKARESARAGATVVGLLPARTDTAYFHDHIYGKAEIRFIRGRLKFGSAKNAAPFPSMVVIWRPGCL
jgi:site-specific DNA-methyltransferase (adenine-specific)